MAADGLSAPPEAYLRVRFSELEWESPASGVRQRRQVVGSRVVRIVEFTEDFTEEDWCEKGHNGYVTEGRLRVDFDTHGSIMYEAGDALCIEAGFAFRHRASIAEGERAVVVLFEEVGE